MFDRSALTVEEIARTLSRPVGTTRARLTVLRRSGRVGYKRPATRAKTTQVCPRCGECKPIGDFLQRFGSNAKRTTLCALCRNKARPEQQRHGGNYAGVPSAGPTIDEYHSNVAQADERTRAAWDRLTAQTEAAKEGTL